MKLLCSTRTNIGIFFCTVTKLANKNREQSKMAQWLWNVCLRVASQKDPDGRWHNVCGAAGDFPMSDKNFLFAVEGNFGNSPKLQ